MILRGYMDESYGRDRNVFALSCLMARGKDWDDMDRRWKRHIAAKNKELIAAGRKPISRYHATDCSGRHKEFAGWSRDERDEFVLKLFNAFKQFPSYTVAIETRLNDLFEVFPEWKNNRLGNAYYLLTQFLLYQIVDDFHKLNPNSNARITLFHDQTQGEGKYDPTILRAFNDAINRKGFEQQHHFTKIAPLTWRDSIALQPADLVAFECFKHAEALLEGRTTIRKALGALVDMDTFGIHSVGWRKDSIARWRERLFGKAQLPSVDE